MVNSRTITFALGILILLVLPLAIAAENGGSDGQIAINRNNTGYVNVGPVYQNPCGNGVYEPQFGESCDGANLAGASCNSLNSAWTGTLSCSSTCTYDTSGCSVSQNTNSNNDDTSSGGGGGGGGSGNTRLSSGSSCVENWVCSNWTECSVDGTQTRVCTDQNNCGTIQLKPVNGRTCDANGPAGEVFNEEDKGFFSFLTGAFIGTGAKVFWPILIILIALGLIWWFVASKKKAEKPIKTKKMSEMKK